MDAVGKLLAGALAVAAVALAMVGVYALAAFVSGLWIPVVGLVVVVTLSLWAVREHYLPRGLPQ